MLEDELVRNVSVAVTQMACVSDRKANIDRAAKLVKTAAKRGAQVVVLQELFESPYFCIEVDKRHYSEAMPIDQNPAVAAMQELARKFDVVIPVSVYESDGNKKYNSLVVIDAGGEQLGVYRKSHIPDFPAYEEAFYFDPGDTGFKVWDTKYVKLGGAVCWDQWFPEAARSMALMGAEVLVYPTAIGRPVNGSPYDFPNSKPHWQQTMQGHAAANMLIVAASNRVGTEQGGGFQTAFYGGSFIANETGSKVAELGEDENQLVVHEFDLDRIAAFRKGWGIFRTRRPDLYDPLINVKPPSYLLARKAS
jgi:N-carbamoylputrescine amidase